MMSATHRLILGACLLAGRSVAFHVPVASSLSSQTRALGGSNTATLLRRKVHSGLAMQASSMQETIEGRLNEALSPMHLEVINESHMHSGPAKESHFKVRVLCACGSSTCSTFCVYKYNFRGSATVLVLLLLYCTTYIIPGRALLNNYYCSTSTVPAG